MHAQRVTHAVARSVVMRRIKTFLAANTVARGKVGGRIVQHEKMSRQPAHDRAHLSVERAQSEIKLASVCAIQRGVGFVALRQKIRKTFDDHASVLDIEPHMRIDAARVAMLLFGVFFFGMLFVLFFSVFFVLFFGVFFDEG